MKHALPTNMQTLGADLRALRKARGLTLSDLAGTLGKSVGWMSQVERDISDPSIDDLRDMATALGVSISALFRQTAAPGEQGLIVRKSNRRPIGARQAGLVEELLSPDLTDDFEVIHSTFQPYARLSQPRQRPTQEVGYIVEGQLDLTIDQRTFHLNRGDSFRIRGETYSWANPHPDPCVAIWVIAPPVY